MIMTQEEKWQAKYDEVKAFIEKNKRNPSKHRIEEHDMLNWVKANRKRMNAGEMKEERVERFKELLILMVAYRRKNQYDPTSEREGIEVCFDFPEQEGSGRSW